MNLIQLIRRARLGVDAILPGGSASAQWGDEEMVDLTNEAYESALREFRLVHKKWGLVNLTHSSSAFTREGETYTPSSSLVLASAGTSITLPPDFAELVRITCSNNRSVRFLPAQSESSSWIDLEQESYDDASNVISSNGLVFYYDFVDHRTLFITPPASGSFNLSLSYVPMRRPLYYSKAGTIALTNASTAVTGTSTTWADDGVTTEAVDAELIIGTDNPQSNLIRVDKDYLRVPTVTSNTAAVLKSVYGGTTASGVSAILAMVPALPREYHRWITRLTSSLMLSKVNPDLAEKYRARFIQDFREQINPVIRRRQSQESLPVEETDLD